MTKITVKRVLTIEYEVDLDSYPNMTREEIRDWESDGDNLDYGMFLDDIKGEEVVVTFSDEVQP